jgi:hypothetical protein
LTLEALEDRSLPSSLSPAGPPGDAVVTAQPAAATQQETFNVEGGTFTVVDDLGKNHYLISLGGTATPGDDFNALFVARKTGANVSGSFTLVFNGSTLDISYSVKKDEKTGVFVGTYTVLGGSGGFQGASGGGQVTYPLDAVTNPFTMTGPLVY